MRKALSIALALVMGLMLAIPACAAENNVVEEEVIGSSAPLALGGEESEVSPATVDTTTPFIIQVGGPAWSKSFKMNKALGEPHTTFKVKISDVTGKYTLVITGDNGYRYESGVQTVGMTKVVPNAVKDVRYTVYVTNPGSTTLSGYVAVNSYY